MRKGKGKNNGLLPNSLRIISSCLKTVSTNATSTVRSAGASVAASISSEDRKDHVTWAGFDRLQHGPLCFKRVLLLGYQNGFQVLDVEDASNFSELVSKRDGPVSFLQMQPFPAKSDDDDGYQGFRSSHPLLLVVAGDDTNALHIGQNHSNLGRGSNAVDAQSGNSVRFYSLRSHAYVHVLRFRSAVHMIRCSPRIVAVGLATQIYCVDALTLESKFSVLTYPVPRLVGQGAVGVNIGYGPMAVGHRWLAYASNNPPVSKTSRLSPQNRSPSPGVSPSTSPGGTSLVARYAMESSKQLAAGVINLGDMGYKTLSRYCQDLLLDGSNSPVPSSSGWKVGRPPGTDMDNAGVVVVMDFVSRAVISQFKVHTSPLSALCFDPSGTLLVTASVYGNNINVFRIMPSPAESVSGVQRYNWSSSHVHLYRLHRGITSAMIQDICFSYYSQWIAVVSAKGTCHIFILSPFGGDPGLHSLNSTGEDLSVLPHLSLPWWYTSACMINQQSSPPPPPVSLSVVSRIKYSSFGWLNTVGGANGVAAGKVFVPSGAVAAVFHNSISLNIQQVNSNIKPLEHLLVYTPSGHVVQHELLPSVGLEAGDGGSRTRSASFVHVQEDDLKVKVEPIQWWDVCRRSDWPEREECISGNIMPGAPEIVESDSSCEDNFIMDFVDMNDDFSRKKTVKPCHANSHERSHWFLSNAEVQISSGRLPIWQKSEISFYVMYSMRVQDFGHGELEIEKVPSQEIEVRRKELLPVLDHFHNFKTSWNDRGLAGVRYNLQSPAEPHQVEGKVAQETVICHSKPASLSSTGSSECGSSRRIEHLLDLDQMNPEKSCNTTCQTLDDFYQERSGSTDVTADVHCVALNNISLISAASTTSLDHPSGMDAHNDYHTESSLLLSHSYVPLVGKNFTGESVTTNLNNNKSDVLVFNAKSCDSPAKIIVGACTLPEAENQRDFGLYSREARCEVADIDGGHGAVDVVATQVGSNGIQCGSKKVEGDKEPDEFLGGMFAFSEEG